MMKDDEKKIRRSSTPSRVGYPVFKENNNNNEKTTNIIKLYLARY